MVLQQKQYLDIVYPAHPGVVVAVALTYALTVTLLPPPRHHPTTSDGRKTTTPTTDGKTTTTPPTNTGKIASTPSDDDSHASPGIEQPGGPVVQVALPDVLPAFCHILDLT